MKRGLLIGVMVGLALLTGWVVLFWDPVVQQPAAYRSLGLDQPPRGGDFTLESWRGEVNLEDFRGKVVLLYFGYTWCPDICPTDLALISGALNRLTPEELEDVQVLFVSVDPERDTSKRLKRYTGYFHPNILGVTGTAQQVAAVADLYGAAYRRVEEESAAGYLVDHSSYTYVIDPRGRLAKVLEHAPSPSKTLSTIRALLPAGVRQGGSPAESG
jgi:protein SCO1/2